ncbi:hypothetical protein G7046_g5719 [Stylonectria norvegica]|nr:hypothetical protein G7046_g5719 [Stylonectria norvegica]
MNTVEVASWQLVGMPMAPRDRCVCLVQPDASVKKGFCTRDLDPGLSFYNTPPPRNSTSSDSLCYAASVVISTFYSFAKLRYLFSDCLVAVAPYFGGLFTCSILRRPHHDGRDGRPQPPTWALYQKAYANVLGYNSPAFSFVQFFPSLENSPIGAEIAAIRWQSCLATPKSFGTPAYTRASVRSQPSTSFKGAMIMKRVGMLMHLHLELVKPDSLKRIKQTHIAMSVQKDVQWAGVPPSDATTMNLIIQAKVDVANNYMLYSSGISAEDRNLARKGTHVQVAPAKRRINFETRDGIPSEELMIVGGNKLELYRSLVPFIVAAMRKGMVQVDLATAVTVEAMIRLNTRRNPRQHLVAYGQPDLSDVAEDAEPESPAAIKPSVVAKEAELESPAVVSPSVIAEAAEPETPTVIRPTVVETDSRSPQKRIASQTTPMKSGFQLIKDSMPILQPAAGPSVEASPTKPSSTPSTPMQQSPALNSSPLRTVLNDTSVEESTPGPVAEGTPVENSTPGRVWTFRAPSYDGSTTLSMQQLTPVNHQASSPFSVPYHLGTRPEIFTSRNEAPTPSRWDRADPSTLDLISFTDSPTPQTSKQKFAVNTKFGVSPGSFGNSTSVVNPSTPGNEARRVRNALSAQRRRSEPLFRKHINKLALRRHSISPLKKGSGEENELPNDTSANSPARSEYSVASDASDASTFAPTKTVDAIIPTATYKRKRIDDDNHPVGKKIFTTEPTASKSSTHEPCHATTDSHEMLNIDMRQNPDIFGATTSSPSMDAFASIEQLAKMAADDCYNQAKVLVTQEHGRLFVRFKLPAQYAHMFPLSQGFDESRFTTTPSQASYSPRIKMAPPGVAHNSTMSDLSSLGNTPTISDFPTFVAQVSPIKLGVSAQSPSEQAAPESSSLSMMTSTPTVSRLRMLGPVSQNTFDTPSEHARSSMSPTKLATIIRTPEHTHNHVTSSPMFSHLGASAMPLSPEEATPANPLSPQEATPTAEYLFANTTIPGYAQATPTHLQQSVDYNTTTNTPVFTRATPTQLQESMIYNTMSSPTGSMAGHRNMNKTLTVAEMEAESSLTFAPSNQTTPQPDEALLTSADPNTPVAQSTPTAQSTSVVQTAPAVQTTPAGNTSSAAPASASCDPERDFYHQFINRARSKKSSTTDAGSPIAPAPKRLPLGAKSPNSSSPQKAKRKLEEVEDVSQSPAKKVKGAEPKHSHHNAKSMRHKAGPHNEADASNIIASGTAIKVEDDEKYDDTNEVGMAPARRSTRLRSQDVAPSGPKSSIPTPIQLNRSRAGRGALPVLNSAVRSGQQDLSTQTRSNTMKNKGKAEHPAQVLAKYKEAKPADDSDGGSAGSTSSTKSQKAVVWKEPLESVQELKSGKGKAKPASKSKATQGNTGISKAKPKATAKSKQAKANLAENLGMVANGTPAKPQRMTRARTRSQQP